MSNIVDLTGQRFGRLIAIERRGTKYRKALWLCRCDCGNMTLVLGNSVKTGNTRSCGCLGAEAKKTSKLKHGMRYKPEYSSWQDMKKRCLNKNTNNYNNYGGRGITICDRWLNSFENFISDMGHKPTPKHSIDRINNEGNYEPSNCRWATRKEQNNNQRKRTDNLSGITGVYRHGNRWVSIYKEMRLGSSKYKLAACALRWKAEALCQ